MTLSIIRSGAALGAEIAGVDLTQPVDDATFAKIRDAFYTHEVVFFRGRRLSDEDHIRFSARFGELRKIKIPPHYKRECPPEIHIVSNIIEDGKHIGLYDAGRFWHTDGAYFINPHAISILNALEVPEKDGRVLGDTLFASVTAAYNALPQAMKKRIEGLQVVQSPTVRDRKTAQTDGDRDPVRVAARAKMQAVHPMVRIHPVNGRKCLYVSEGYAAQVIGMPEDESNDLLAELTAHCVKPEFVYRHNWRLHDMIMWDDCSTQHKATFDYELPLRRRMHRTTVIHGNA